LSEIIEKLLPTLVAEEGEGTEWNCEPFISTRQMLTHLNTHRISDESDGRESTLFDNFEQSITIAMGHGKVRKIFPKS
jgi:hypothetical protein